MGSLQFQSVAMNEKNSKWNESIQRNTPLYMRKNDIRTEFDRDYTRILHSESYRRLKHKTQVFFETQNDLVCTRIEHVNHVESVSTTISQQLGLNTALTSAIAIGHDLGHAPFGHEGEKVLSNLANQYLNTTFWHEKNGLRVVECLDLLEDNRRNLQNLDLTYAVKDGIISHCGEVDDTQIFPRDTYISLNEFEQGKTMPFTWEACVVKLSDKIAYVGRDIEDAKRLQLLSMPQLFQLKKLAKEFNINTINTTTIIHDLIIDVCNNSSPDNGLLISSKMSELLYKIKKYNYDNIYSHPRLNIYKNYVKLLIESIFQTLLEFYDGIDTIHKIRQAKYYPNLYKNFSIWLTQRCDLDLSEYSWARNCQRRSKNIKIYGCLDTKEVYIQAIIDYISCMTDSFAVQIFNELCKF